jgi:threonine/homoserine/homoserine lactone efflux protein
MIEFLRVLPAFALTVLIIVAVPGQGVAMVLRQSILAGKQAAFYSVIGNTSGLVIWGVLSSVGLSAIFQASPTAFNTLKWAGVAYLTLLSFQTLLELRNQAGKFEYEAGEKAKGFGPAFRIGITTNLTNVKAAVFSVGLVPQFVPESFNLGWGIFILSLIWAVISMSWYSLMITVVDKSSKWIQKPKVRRALTAFSAVGIAVLAIGLAFTRAN